MVKKIESYVDTSALIAFVDRSDSYHPLFRRLFSDPPRLVTTTLVIAEGHGWFLKRYDRIKALGFLGLIDALRPLSIEPVGRKHQDHAADILRRFSDQDLTMTDAVGLSLMETQKITNCWSTDFHLGLTGVPLVIHDY